MKKIDIRVSKKDLWVVIGIAIFVIVDLLTKAIFDGAYGVGGTGKLIPFLFNICVVHNEGASWGIMQGSGVLLVFVTIVFMAVYVIFYLINKNKTKLFYAASMLIMAGALGNLIDRIIFGYVRDFIQFAFWTSFPVFNLADAFITIGVVLLMLYFILPLPTKKVTITVELPEEDNDE